MEEDESQSSQKLLLKEQKKQEKRRILKINIEKVLANVPVTLEGITRKIGLNYIYNLKEKEEVNEGLLYTSVTSLYDRETHALSLAICGGNKEILEKFLTVIPDINSPMLEIEGYRQPYTPAHCALTPIYPWVDVDLRTRLEIVDLLGKKGADFNRIPKSNTYSNPPLDEGDGWLYARINHKGQESLRGRALLWGADPLKKGSSFSGLPYAYKHFRCAGCSHDCGVNSDDPNVSFRHAPIYKEALYAQGTGKGDASKLTPYVKGVLKRIYIEKFKKVCQKENYCFESQKMQKILNKRLQARGLQEQ